MPRLTKKDIALRLASVPEDKALRGPEGFAFRTLVDLGKGLRYMSQETFSQHVTSARNDFANWVREAIGDEKLARDLLQAPSPELAARQVAERISYLSSRLY